MKKIKIPKRSTIRLIALFVAILLLGSGCAQIKAWTAVRTFHKHAGRTIASAFKPADDFQKQQSEQLVAMIAERNHDHELLQAAYGTSGDPFRFVKGHVPTKDHELLAARIDQLYGEGIDPAPYAIDKRKQYEQDLVKAHEYFESLQLDNILIGEQELTALRKALVAAENVDLSVVGIMEFISAPEQQGHFPVLQKTITQASEAALARKRAEARLEFLDAVNYFRLARDMGLADEDLMPSWQKSTTDMAGALQDMIPVNYHYHDLVKELARYRKIAKTHEPIEFPRNKKVKPGQHGEFVKLVQQRLKMEDYWDGPIDGQFDEQFKQALIAYQETHQVQPDGVIFRGTLESFNIPFTWRVKQIKLALEKIRRSSIRGENYFVWVNVGGQQLEVFAEGGKKMLRKHRIIVGNRMRKNHTPLFSDEIEKIVFNPSWLVPERIIKEEMLPAYLKNPAYFKRRGYHAIIIEENPPAGSESAPSGGENAPSAGEGAGEGEEGAAPPPPPKKVKITAVTQPPGQRNALGVVKILFPNRYAVYLHDTPTKHLFKRALRPYSHGCMRLQDAVELARFLLQQDDNEFAPQVDELLEARKTKVVHLNKKVPIHIEYITTMSDENGRAVFYADIYNIDKEILEAMIAD